MHDYRLQLLILVVDQMLQKLSEQRDHSHGLNGFNG